MLVKELMNNDSFSFEVPCNVVIGSVRREVLFSNLMYDEVPDEVGNLGIRHITMMDEHIEIEVSVNDYFRNLVYTAEHCEMDILVKANGKTTRFHVPDVDPDEEYLIEDMICDLCNWFSRGDDISLTPYEED